MAKKIITQSEKFTKKMAINAATSQSLQDMIGNVLTNIQAAAILEDVDRETGEIKQVAVIVDGNGTTYTSISAVVVEQMADIIDFLEDGEPFDLAVIVRKSKGNRDYITLNIV